MKNVRTPQGGFFGLTLYRQIVQKRSISVGEQWTICAECDAIILVFVWRKSIRFWQRYEQKTIFTFSFPVTLTLWPSDLKFTSTVPLVSAELKVSTAFLLRRHGMDKR